MFLYRPITGDYLPELAFDLLAYWIPEVLFNADSQQFMISDLLFSIAAHSSPKTRKTIFGSTFTKNEKKITRFTCITTHF